MLEETARQIPMGRVGTTDEIAGLVVFLASPFAGLHHGLDLSCRRRPAGKPDLTRGPASMNREQDIPWYPRALDFEALHREFPPPPDYFRTIYKMPRDELRALQEKRFLQTMARGWEIPFFQRHWGKAGMEKGDVRSLADIEKVPPYTVRDIRDSIERAPPFGDFMGISPRTACACRWSFIRAAARPDCRGRCSTRREKAQVMAILGGRRFVMHGVRPGDMVLVTYALGLCNGAIASRERLWGYTGAVPVMTGSGAITPTRRQIELAQAVGHQRHRSACPRTFVIWRMVARDEMGIDPRSLGITLVAHAPRPGGARGRRGAVGRAVATTPTARTRAA